MKYCLLFFALCIFSAARAQYKLYVSKSTGQFTHFNGSYSWSSDNYEQGDFTLSTEGAIVALVDPYELSIRPNQAKAWNGIISPDTAMAPPPGQAAKAALKYDGLRSYSRPAAPVSGNETIKSTYYCKGCPAHPGGGQHQIVQVHDKGQMEFVVYTLGVTIEGPDCAYRGSKLPQTAHGSPEGGTYTWKSLSTNLQVAGNGAEAIVTSKNPTGKGEIEVDYTVEGVTHKQKKEVTFFDLSTKLGKNKVCDGESVKITLKVSPPVTPLSKVMEALDSLQVKAQPILGKNEKASNIAGHTNIDFPAFDDKDFTSISSPAFWFIGNLNKNRCDTLGRYDIWVEANNKFAENKKIQLPKLKLAVNVGFGSCVNGDAFILLDTPKHKKPVYKNPDFGMPGDSGIVKFEQPGDNYPVLSIKWKKADKKFYVMSASYEVGGFKIDKKPSSIKTTKESQFRPLVEFEEGFHVKQYGGQTKIKELQNLLSAEQVVKEVNSVFALPNNLLFFKWSERNTAFKKYSELCWLTFVSRVAGEIMEYNNVTSGWARNIRCRLEAEAKEALNKQFPGATFTVDMPCAYPGCLVNNGQ